MINRFYHTSIFRIAAVILVALALSMFVSSCADDKSDISQAAADGNLAKVKAILDSHPALVSDKDNYDTTPLDYAAQNNRKDVVELLIDKGADVKARNSYGDTALNFAATSGAKDVVELLIDKGADVNNQDAPPLNETPLASAQKEGYTDIVALLRQHGAQ
jgi:ankyrin repeat protein